MSDTSNDTETSPPPVPRSLIALRKFVFVMGVFAVFWLVFGQIVPRFFFAHPEETPPLAVAPAADNRQLAELQNRIVQLEAAMKSAAAPVADNSAADAKIAAMQAQVATLQQQPSGSFSSDNDRLSRIEERLTQQESEIATMKAQTNDAQAKSTQQLAAMTTFGQMRDAIVSGALFSAQLQALEKLTPGDGVAQQLLAELKPYAASGAPTLDRLQQQFETAILKALASDPKAGTLERDLQSLIRVRKVGEQQQGIDDQAIIARAEAKLGRGDIDAASKEIAALSPPAAHAFSGWSEQAKTFLRLRAVTDALQLALVQDTPAATQ